MGPRPRGRGSKAIMASHTSTQELQWGPDHVVGDRRVVGDVAALVRGGFNGAPTTWSGIGRVPRGQWLPKLQLQWGPDPVVGDRFRAGCALDERPRASMGPRPRGRGSRGPLRGRHVGRVASMGPRP